MTLTAQDWNVIVVGHWNRAILSPAGIAKRLFNLPEGTPVQVLVPLDVVAPYHVRHENLTVIPSNDRLVVQPVHNNVENLVEAIEVCQRALVDLPRTPVFAAGLNLRFNSAEGIDTLQRIIASPWDDNIDGKSLKIASRAVSRSVYWREGKITTAITQEESGACSIHLNFDFQSQDSDKLRQWLDMTAPDIHNQTNLILLDTVGLSSEDFNHG